MQGSIFLGNPYLVERMCKYDNIFNLKSVSKNEEQVVILAEYRAISLMLFWRQLGIVICAILMLVTCLGIYFATQLSATYPPIKQYEIDLPLDQFEGRLSKLFSNNADICLLHKDTTGTREDGFRYYIDIQRSGDSSNYTIRLAYEIHRRVFSDRVGVTMDLIGAFDLLKNTGGYDANSDGVQKIITSFENEVLVFLDPSRKTLTASAGRRIVSKNEAIEITYFKRHKTNYIHGI